MAEQSAVPMIVLTRHQDNVEAVNSTLRKAGHAVRCTWIRELKDLAKALEELKPHMLIAFVGADPLDAANVMAVCKQAASTAPVLIARDQVDEEIIAAAMQHGARDAVTVKHPGRLQAVVARELQAHRQLSALNSAMISARECREKLQALMAESADAIAYVQEGIVVDANPAWQTLYGAADVDSLIGAPLMDSFAADAHGALKGALLACLQGKSSQHPLRANAVFADGSVASMQIELSRTQYEGEPAVRVCIPAAKQAGGVGSAISVGSADESMSDALERDAATGALQRRFFVERLQRTLAQPIKAGVRQLASIEPDELEGLGAQLGPLALEEFIAQFGALVNGAREPGDLCGRFGEGAFMLLIARGTARDVETWANNLVRKVAGQVFRVGDKQISCTCSLGLAMVDPRKPNAATSLADAIEARRKAQEAGGARIQAIDRRDEDTRQEAADEIWARQIKAALTENRFRLLQQPIASLLGEDRGMFDVLVRMLDAQEQELLPAEFMPAAERTGLMRNVDRWVIGAAFALAASRPVQHLFVRLSRDSARDKSLPAWLADQLKNARIQPQRIAFQISEQVAAEHLGDASELASSLRKAGFLFALEHFGTGRDPGRLLAHLPLDFVKIDGELMQGLAVDQALQQRVRELVDQAKAKNAATIAERVQDANTMAVLWQLGIEFIQGYFVNEPEQVVIG
ncbi:MAG TPA: EAL domain-containing protein [Steroidobacter sp.]|nr:EAL domain-containing protein [Steroidobacter sp.]